MIVIAARTTVPSTKFQNFQVTPETDSRTEEMSSSPFLQWLLVGLIVFYHMHGPKLITSLFHDHRFTTRRSRIDRQMKVVDG